MSVAIKKSSALNKLNLTPMIDVVFQLLIFFMVTSTFAMQKALPVPTPEPTDAAAQQPSLDGVSRLGPNQLANRRQPLP